MVEIATNAHTRYDLNVHYTFILFLFAMVIEKFITFDNYLLSI